MKQNKTKWNGFGKIGSFLARAERASGASEEGTRESKNTRENTREYPVIAGNLIPATERSRSYISLALAKPILACKASPAG